jgi:hypothetical protein
MKPRKAFAAPKVKRASRHKLARLKEQAKIRRYRGKLHWIGDLGKSRQS